MNEAKTTKSRVANFAILFASTVFALLLAEGVARALRLIPEPVVPADVGQFDAQLGWSLRPSTQAVSNATGKPVLYKINSAGFRDDEYLTKKTPGLFRIALIGDSHSFGYGVSKEDHFSTILEQLVPNTEVLNFGVSGYGVDQYLLRLNRDALAFNPDLVITYIPYYHGERHLRAKTFGEKKPYFELVGDELLLRNSPVIRAQRSTSQKIHRWLQWNWHSYQIITSGLPYLVRPKTTPPKTPADEPKASSTSLNLMGFRLVREMHDNAKKNGAEFLLITRIPELHRQASEAGIASLNVRDLLSDTSYLLADGHGHINERGSRVLAKEISSELLKRSN